MMVLSTRFFSVFCLFLLFIVSFLVSGCEHIYRSDYKLPRATAVRSASGKYHVRLQGCDFPNKVGMKADSPEEFGCATERNFEVMLAQPEDLVHPKRLKSIPADQFPMRRSARGGSVGSAGSGGR